MKTVRLSDLLKREIKPFLFGAFLSLTRDCIKDGKSYFYTYTKFRASKAVFRDDFDMKSYADALAQEYNHHSGYYNWQVHKSSETAVDVRFCVENDLAMSKTMFYQTLYKRLLSSNWVAVDSLTEEKKDCIRGFMEPRGSVDTTMKLIAQDYFYDNRTELKKAQILTGILNLPICFANFNPRNLQPQFVSGESQRNAQFRINLFYYANKIGFINKYKAKVFENSYYTNGKHQTEDVLYFDVDVPQPKDEDVAFVKYLNFFTNNIYEKTLTPAAVKSLRKRLGFDGQSNLTQRNRSVVEIYSEISEDKCAVCGTTETYTNKRTGRQYFEIHHMISYYNGKECDNIANLVKLCPTCHRMLKKGSASKETQMKAIVKILHEHAEIFEFASSYLGIEDISDLAESIWEMLG